MDDPDFSLVMPFTVCSSNGGPYEDDAFVAGVYFGMVHERVERVGWFEGYVPTALVPQLDLLAMHHGMKIHSTPWDEHPTDWSYVNLEADAALGFDLP